MNALVYHGVHAKLYDMEYVWGGWCECFVENNADVTMPDVALHEAVTNEETGFHKK